MTDQTVETAALFGG
jgi:hypothetical protein